MFDRLKNRFNDMRTIRQLCESAERFANDGGETQPGLEHFVLAACELPDGSAGRAMARIGITPEAFRQAIADQYRSALDRIGIAAPALAPAPAPQASGPYQAKAQVGELMEALCRRDKAAAGDPLMGIDVLDAILAVEHGVAARAFAHLGIDRDKARKMLRS